MKSILSLLLFLAVATTCHSQREFNVNDSTFYVLDADTTIVAGARQLYLLTPGGLQTLRDFTADHPGQYIRDFDLVRPDLWYTVIGKPIIGDSTTLYRSTDRGASWARDTSFYSATRQGGTGEFYSINLTRVQ